MSLITRCPACGTQFRVVPDQLKISDGWVRCGQCSDVFDAQAALVVGALAEAAQAAPADLALSQQPVSPPEPVASAEGTSQTHGFADTTADDGPAVTPEPATAVPGPDAEFDPTSPVEADATVRVEPTLDPQAEAEAEAEANPEAEAVPEAGDTPVPEPALDDVSFVRRARRRAFWQQPLVRAALVGLAGLLGLLLAAQVAIQQRDVLAQQAPALRPLLEALCRPLDCRIGSPRRIESLVIDNSNFTRLRPDAYQLAVTLSNQSPVAVAMPALELTLTDSQDQPILRRVIAPTELGQGAASLIGAKAEWSAALTVAVTPNASTARIVGYRLLAFYP